MSVGHQDQTHPQSLTSGATDLAAQLLINQSDERTRIQDAMGAWKEKSRVWRASLDVLLCSVEQADAFVSSSGLCSSSLDTTDAQ